MKVELNQYSATIRRTKSDKRPHSESQLLYKVRNELRAQGHDVIKRLMWKDGHLVADTQHYLRERKGRFALWDVHYAIRNLAEDFWTKGEVKLARV